MSHESSWLGLSLWFCLLSHAPHSLVKLDMFRQDLGSLPGTLGHCPCDAGSSSEPVSLETGVRCACPEKLGTRTHGRFSASQSSLEKPAKGVACGLESIKKYAATPWFHGDFRIVKNDDNESLYFDGCPEQFRSLISKIPSSVMTCRAAVLNSILRNARWSLAVVSRS